MISNSIACSVCYNNFNNQKHLPMLLKSCGHSFCCSCIATIINTVATCPLCRSIIHKEVNPVVVNYQLVEAIDAFCGQSKILNAKQIGELLVIPSKCDQHNRKAIFFGAHSKQYLCADLCDVDKENFLVIIKTIVDIKKQHYELLHQMIEELKVQLKPLVKLIMKCNTECLMIKFKEKIEEYMRKANISQSDFEVIQRSHDSLILMFKARLVSSLKFSEDIYYLKTNQELIVKNLAICNELISNNYDISKISDIGVQFHALTINAETKANIFQYISDDFRILYTLFSKMGKACITAMKELKESSFTIRELRLFISRFVRNTQLVLKYTNRMAS